MRQDIVESMHLLDTLVLSFTHLAISYKLYQLDEACSYVILQIYSASDLLRLIKLIREL